MCVCVSSAFSVLLFLKWWLISLFKVDVGVSASSILFFFFKIKIPLFCQDYAMYLTKVGDQNNFHDTG